ncbi:MAG TPA: asparaginase [Planctomycetota bacterium]|nr:asparaginase [Planctomycetota bacterium]
MSDPLRVEFGRGGRVESVHRVHAAVVQGKKRLLARGDVRTPVFMRSSAKPIQAIAVVETGTADAFDLTAEELAVVCGSHGADEVHLAAVASILMKAGLTSTALDCGTHPPSSPKALKALHAKGEEPTAMHNNCAGKHAGMTATAKHMREPVETYLAPTHPVQKRNLENVARFTGVPARSIKLGIDGCSAPTFAVPLEAMARASARLATEDGAAKRVREAMMAHPVMVGRPCEKVMAAAPGKIVAKAGAEGVYMVGFPESGVGLAVKVEDGAGRALLYALSALVRKLRLLKSPVALADPVLKNHAGRHVGDVTVGL